LQIIGSRILGYTEWAKWSFWDFHDIFFVRNSSFYAKPPKNSEIRQILLTKVKTKIFVLPSQKNFVFPKCPFFAKKTQKTVFDYILKKGQNSCLEN
jgi:hypothetical protein